MSFNTTNQIAQSESSSYKRIRTSAAMCRVNLANKAPVSIGAASVLILAIIGWPLCNAQTLKEQMTNQSATKIAEQYPSTCEVADTPLN